MRNGGILSSSPEVMAFAPLESRSSGTLSDRIAAQVIKGSAFVAIIALVLIFVFIGKEALPVLTSPEVHKEADLKTIFLPQPAREGGEGAEYTWQPVSEHPKYSILPLFVGTLKVTLIAVIIAVPLALLTTTA